MKILFLIAALCGFTAFAKAQDVALVVHPDFAETSVTADDVKQILLGSLAKWRGGQVVKLVVLTDGAVHTKVIRDFTQRTPEQFDKFWKRLVFTGAGTLPAQAKSDAEVIAYVAANPGAIGYVAVGSVSANVQVLSLH